MYLAYAEVLILLTFITKRLTDFEPTKDALLTLGNHDTCKNTKLKLLHYKIHCRKMDKVSNKKENESPITIS